MSKSYQIHSVVDMLALTPDEFRRMLPDLCTWYSLAKELGDMVGVQNLGFQWRDDGVNDVTSFLATDPETGKTTEYPV